MTIFASDIRTINNNNHSALDNTVKSDIMKKYIVLYSPTAGAQLWLMSLTNKASDPIYQFETTDINEALEVAKKEVEVSDHTKIEELQYSPTDDEFYKNSSKIEILEMDEDGELADCVEFDSPTYWVE